jgi:hypothetical protein
VPCSRQAIWLNRNGVIFDKSSVSTCMQVIYRGTYWTREWSAFQKEGERQLLLSACHQVEILTMEIFVKHG